MIKSVGVADPMLSPVICVFFDGLFNYSIYNQKKKPQKLIDGFQEVDIQKVEFLTKSLFVSIITVATVVLKQKLQWSLYLNSCTLCFHNSFLRFQI